MRLRKVIYKTYNFEDYMRDRQCIQELGGEFRCSKFFHNIYYAEW